MILVVTKASGSDVIYAVEYAYGGKVIFPDLLLQTKARLYSSLFCSNHLPKLSLRQTRKPCECGFITFQQTLTFLRLSINSINQAIRSMTEHFKLLFSLTFSTPHGIILPLKSSDLSVFSLPRLCQPRSRRILQQLPRHRQNRAHPSVVGGLAKKKKGMRS
jgi:hypothetical protein